jgi:hypothetical protein
MCMIYIRGGYQLMFVAVAPSPPQVGMWVSRDLMVPISHEDAFHQARSSSYHPEVRGQQHPVSFHKVSHACLSHSTHCIFTRCDFRCSSSRTTRRIIRQSMTSPRLRGAITMISWITRSRIAWITRKPNTSHSQSACKGYLSRLLHGNSRGTGRDSRDRTRLGAGVLSCCSCCTSPRAANEKDGGSLRISSPLPEG